MLGKIKGRRRRGRQEDEMVGWHDRLNGHGFGWTPEVGDGQGGLSCCGSWGHKESDMTEQLNLTELYKSTKLRFLCLKKKKKSYSIPIGITSGHIFFLNFF